MSSRFALKTWSEPRPSRSDDRYAHLAERDLAAIQAEWDTAREGDVRRNDTVLQTIAKRAQDEADRRAKEAAREEAQRAQAEAPLIENARTAFIRSGGSAEDFEKNRDAILAQVRGKLAVDAAVSAVKPEPSFVRNIG